MPEFNPHAPSVSPEAAIQAFRDAIDREFRRADKRMSLFLLDVYRSATKHGIAIDDDGFTATASHVLGDDDHPVTISLADVADDFHESQESDHVDIP